MDLDFQLNVLDFEKIFNSIDVDEKLSVVMLVKSNPEQTEFIVLDKTPMEIHLEEVSSKKPTTWKKNEFISNKYNILDLQRDVAMELPETILKTSFDELEPQFVNYESVYIQKNDYEQIFPIRDQIDAINQYYLSRIENPSHYARTIIQKKADVLGSFIQNFNHIPKSTDIPILDQMKENHFYSPLLRPIVYDSKYIFKESAMFDQEDVRNYFREDEDKLIITLVDQITDEYRKKGNDKLMKYTDFQNVLIYGGDLPFAIKLGQTSIQHVKPLMSSYLPINRLAERVIEETTGLSRSDIEEKIQKVAGYSLNVSDFTDVYRFITPAYPFGPGNIVQTSVRRTQGSKMILHDRPDQTEIGKKQGSRECSGTARTSESQYFSNADPYVPTSVDGIRNAFNRCISKEPTQIPATDGEEIFVVGMFFKSPFSITPPNNILYKKKNNSVLPIDYFIENRNGWWNVMDRVIQSRSVARQHRLKEISMDDEPDFNEDNIILFEKASFRNMSKDEFQKKLTKIIPSTNKILQIEDDNLKIMNNITDLNKILSKYFLSHKNLNVKQMDQMERLLQNAYFKYKTNSDQEKRDVNYFKSLNAYCHQLFHSVYESICRLQMQNNINEEEICAFIETHFQSFDMQHVSHILKFYYGLDTAAYLDKSKMMSILVHLFSKRYSDYMQSDSPVRLLLLPNFYIEDVVVQKYADFIRRFYNFDALSHAPSSIGLINELYHRMFIRDSSMHFNYFAEFVYSATGYNKIVRDEEELFQMYSSADAVQTQLDEIDRAIYLQKMSFQTQEMVCSKYELSKFYSSKIDLLNDNNKEDIRVDKIFDKTATLNSIYAIHGKNSGPYIKQAYPNEPAEWHESIMKILEEKGKLTGAIVEDSMWALLVDATSYALYQRNNNVWEFRLSVPEIARVEVPYNKKTKQYGPPKNISALCNLEGRDAAVVDKIADFIFFGLKQTQNSQENDRNRDGKCVAFENSCYSKIILQLNKKRMELQSIVKAFTYYRKQKLIYSAKAFDRRQLMEELLQQYERTERTKLAKQGERASIVDVAVREEKKTSAFSKQWNLIVQIPEIDVRYDEMNKFIQTYGMLEKRVDKSANRLIDSTDWTNIYYNNTEIPEILCCKHYLFMVKQAWQSNDVRHELQEILEDLFKGDDSNEAVIFCKYCGENIGQNRESDFEGFDDSEHAIVLREAVAEQSDENLPILEHEVQTEMYDSILVELMQTLQFQLKAKDITEMMQNAGHIYVKSKPNIFQFEIKMAEKMKPDSLYRKARDVIKGPLTDDILKSRPDLKRLFDQQIRVLYNRYDANLMVNTVIFQLMLHLLIVDPEIKLNPIGSRFSECRISIINNCVLNVEAFFTMFAQVIYCIAKAATDPNSIFKIYREFFSTAQFNVEQIKKTFSDKFKDHVDKNEIYKKKFDIKHAKYTAQFEITKQLVLDSAVWKSFRPILKLGMPDAELSKINLQSIRAAVSSSDKVLSSTEIQYAAFQLSNYLFYSIQKVIQEQSTLMAGQSFSNYCCIQPLRTKYLEYFMQLDSSISECIELMRRIEPQSFYNPNQSSWLVCGGQGEDNIVIENKCPLLLDYFQDAQILLGEQDQLKHRIRTLYKTYCLGPSETGQRRLYSQLYDEYLGMVNVASSQDIFQRIKEDHPLLEDIDIQLRVRNLYSETDPGLIRKDIITDKYSWTIQQEAETIISANDANLLDLYERLVLSLNQSSNLKIANESFKPIRLKQRYDSESMIKGKQLNELKHIFNDLVNAISENNGEHLFGELEELNVKLQAVVDPDTDMTEIFENINKEEYLSFSIDRARLVIQFDKIGGCTAIINEKINRLSSYIQIEGYSQEQIETQTEIRRAIANHEDELKNFENLKQYYLFVMETISKFVNYKLYNKFVIHSVNRHKELSENVNQSRKYNFNLNHQKFVDYVAINPEYTRLTKEHLLKMGKAIPFQNIQNLFVPLQTNKILNPQYLFLVIYYLLHKTLKNFVDEAPNAQFAIDFIKTFIQDESFEEFNCLTEEKVKTHLRDLIKKQNTRRKKQVDEINMDESRRMQYKLIRDLNLGNILGQEMKELSSVSNEVVDAPPPVVIDAAPAAEGAADDISASEIAVNPRDRPEQLQMGTRVDRDTDDVGNDDAFGDTHDYE